jgi:metallo-beta-lactamase class B
VYRVGTIEHSAWAVTTSAGIILMDAIFDYNVQDEVVEGLRKLGQDPTTIKYAIIGHGHGDHVGGAKLLQAEFNTHIILAAPDWDLLDRTGPSASSAARGALPKRDMVGTDGMKVTLGDTTVTVYTTPGHTQGTLSSIIPVKDGGKPHVVAYWGGTMFNWIANRAQYITPRTPDKYWFDTYAASAARFRDIAARAGADVIMSNHTDFDNTKIKEPQLALRKPGDAFHPYVVGTNSVQRYLTTVGECAQAGSLMSKSS